MDTREAVRGEEIHDFAILVLEAEASSPSPFPCVNEDFMASLGEYVTLRAPTDDDGEANTDDGSGDDIAALLRKTETFEVNNSVAGTSIPLI
jgi:hypothetical protein